jgi:hypothetical protein
MGEFGSYHLHPTPNVKSNFCAYGLDSNKLAITGLLANGVDCKSTTQVQCECVRRDLGNQAILFDCGV